MSTASTVDWHRLREIFHAALGWPPAERASRLARECGDDVELMDEVRSLLDAHVAAETFLERPLASLVGGGTGEEPAVVVTEPLAQRIGPYLLQRYLGQGGMGTVFLAARADDAYRDQVAIKVVRHDLATEEMVARFRRERQVLADLRDPSIAQLLDGGTTADGRPYLVMEFVDGEPIDAFCDRHQLTIPARLRLFLTVCRAVHHAHQRLVVHRDLKPANLLVTTDGRPKLLDFGVAKLLPSSEYASEMALTREQAPMTLDYASPEQVLGRSVTTASDVYALGVVLFELLAGDRPFRLGGLAPEDLLAAVRDRDPPFASQAVLRHAEDDAKAAVGHAAHRGTTPARWCKLLAGDLDTIVAKALHKEPARRYASAEDLAQDLERHLAGLPVRARPDRAAYRLGKFVGRHRLGVIASVIALVAFLGFVSMLVHKQRQVIQQNARAEITADFLIDLFDLSNPDAFYEDPALRALYPEHLRGQDVDARQLLKVGAGRIARLADDPDVQVSLLLTMGRAYQGLGLFTPAGELFEQASKLLDEGAKGSRARALVGLGAVRREQVRYDQADRLLRQAVAITGSDPAGRALQAEAHAELARLAIGQGRFEEGLGAADTALALVREEYGPGHAKVAAALAARGNAAREGGDRVAAARDFVAAAALYQRLYGAPHPRLAEIRHYMGLLHKENGDLEAAEQAYRDSLAQRREIHGARHPSIARSMHNLADFLREAGRLDEAAALARESMEMFRAIHGEAHPTVGLGLNLLGLVFAGRNDFVTAESYYREALDLWRPAIDSGHVWVASAHNNLAHSLAKQGRLDEAEAHYQQALDSYRRRFSGPHFQIARVLSNLGALHRRKGELGEAERVYREALEIQRATLPAGHLDQLGTLHNLAVALLVAKRPADAEPLAREAVDAHAAKLGPDHQLVGGVRITLGRVLAALGQREAAARSFREAERVLSATQEEDHPWRIFLAAQLEALAEEDVGR